MEQQQDYSPFILIADDEPNVRQIITHALRKENYRLLEASNGQEAIELFKRVQPEIVLLDVMMPKVHGIDACQQIRALPEGKRTPIIIITAMGDFDTVEKAFAVGATDYLTKPFRLDILRLRLKNLVRTLRAEHELVRYTRELQARTRDLDFYSQVLATTLKNPLTKIDHSLQNIAQRYKGDLLPDDLRQEFLAILKSSHATLRILDRVNYLATLRDPNVLMAPVAVHDAIECALRRHAARLKERGITVTVGAEIPNVMGYAAWVEEIFSNLIDNAIKFIGKDNHKPEIKIVGERQHDTAYFAVVDNGVGIAPPAQKHLFKLFTRFHETEAEEGVGLGLSIVATLVKLSNGKVGVKSNVGTGSTFWFMLPTVQIKRLPDQKP